MACIDSIVTLGICPDEGVSKSGLTLMQAPGISPNILADIASETYVKGTTLAMEKKRLILTQVKNDFYGALHLNNVMTQLPETEYNSSYFIETTDKGTYDGMRGVIINKAHRTGNLRKTYIKTIELFPLQSGETTLQVKVGGLEYNYPITVVADQINVFDEDTLDGFPFEVPPQYANVRVSVDQSDISFASAEIQCMQGCGGKMPNDCAWAEGWDGVKKVKSEGYGVNVTFYCKCDYDQILCDLSNSFSGEIVWLKWQIAILEEQYQTDRFNNWVIYNREDIQKHILPDLENKYVNKWNSLMAGMPGILKNYRDSCLNCKGIRWRSNV